MLRVRIHSHTAPGAVRRARCSFRLGIGEFGDYCGVARLRRAPAAEPAPAEFREQCHQVVAAQQVFAVPDDDVLAAAVRTGRNGLASGEAGRCQPPRCTALPTYSTSAKSGSSRWPFRFTTVVALTQSSPPAGWRPGGVDLRVAHHSTLSKVVMDVPPASHDRELAFWSAAAGQPLTQFGRHPECHGTALHGQDFWPPIQRLGQRPAGRTSTYTPTTWPPKWPGWRTWRRRRTAGAPLVGPARSPGLLFCVIPEPADLLSDSNAHHWD
jgi:hypothetical protein